eukprot:TRINITY_DN30817_c0_g1_i2.p1 TRINITY_DN30817_c0_g1~~TRINITY_DN30817_c0_g1_i2.p1  ORF type:complete len:307 (+),score=21.34 TRINITY_DN30817_c0_g1_i2:87-1007(+)
MVARWSEEKVAFWATLLTLLVHLLHPLVCMWNYLDWVRHQKSGSIGPMLVDMYLALSVIALLAYLFIVSVFYMWALRWPTPLRVARHRRTFGICINLVLCDVPIFVLEVRILWLTGVFASTIQGVTFLTTCLSFGYSAFRSWFFLMDCLIRQAHPKAIPLGVKEAVGCGLPLPAASMPPTSFDFGAHLGGYGRGRGSSAFLGSTGTPCSASRTRLHRGSRRARRSAIRPSQLSRHGGPGPPGAASSTAGPRTPQRGRTCPTAAAAAGGRAWSAQRRPRASPCSPPRRCGRLDRACVCFVSLFSPVP